jgi:hypothetical protein
MPRDPRGEKRPADVIGAAVMAAKIATENSKNESATAELGRKGGKARSARRVAEIARKGAQSRRIGPAKASPTQVLLDGKRWTTPPRNVDAPYATPQPDPQASPTLWPALTAPPCCASA